MVSWSPQWLLLPTHEGRTSKKFLQALSTMTQKLFAPCMYRVKLCLLRDKLTGAFESTFPIYTQSFASTDAHVQTCLPAPVSMHKNSLMLFSLCPFEIKDENWEGVSEHLEMAALPITHWYDPGYREGLDCQQCWLPARTADFKQAGWEQSIFENYAATFFFILQG